MNKIQKWFKAKLYKYRLMNQIQTKVTIESILSAAHIMLRNDPVPDEDAFKATKANKTLTLTMGDISKDYNIKGKLQISIIIEENKLTSQEYNIVVHVVDRYIETTWEYKLYFLNAIDRSALCTRLCTEKIYDGQLDAVVNLVKASLCYTLKNLKRWQV